ncbi:MAG: hypothetical protein DSZ09_05540, partial [Sulfurovum sp.]
AEFNFQGCSGSGTFEQQIESYNGDYNNAVYVGEIPKGIQGLHINLVSDKDVDIRLYGENNDKIIHWPYGILSLPREESKAYKNVTITYSGYNGVEGKKGNEFITIAKTTPTKMRMEAFGYESGYATVNYSWTGKEGCSPKKAGTGDFTQNIKSQETSLVGTIPPHIKDVTIQLTSDKDLDIQLYGADGTAIVSWEPKGLLFDSDKKEIDYHGMHIEWSGYDGVNEQKGNEYIKITGTTSEMLVMKVHGYEAGTAHIKYKWGEANQKILPLLMIRIAFNDYTFHNSDTIWHNKIFGVATGNLNHYMKEISYNTFQYKGANEDNGIHNDGIITVSLNENHPNTAGDSEAFLSRLNRAVSLADPFIDFSQYDTNHDGAISKDELQIMFIVAGQESATGGNPGVWAHSWCMYGDNAVAPTHDGVELMSCQKDGTYSLFGERQIDHDATIGVIAHELGHAVFDLPDLYDTDGSSNGIGNFGLMGGGAWNTKPNDSMAGETPVHMTGWSKIKAGFITPITIDTNKENLSVIGSASFDYTLYKIPTGKKDEYFLLENREAKGYDMGLTSLDGTYNYTGGLSILHIDDTLDVNSDETHKLVDIVEANDAGLDNATHSGHINNLYFSGNADTFNDTTTPNANRYDGTQTAIDIRNISDATSVMTLDVSIN